MLEDGLGVRASWLVGEVMLWKDTERVGQCAMP